MVTTPSEVEGVQMAEHVLCESVHELGENVPNPLLPQETAPVASMELARETVSVQMNEPAAEVEGRHWTVSSGFSFAAKIVPVLAEKSGSPP